MQEASPLRELTCHMGSHSITCHPCSPHSKRHLSRLNHYNTRYYFNVCSKADISRHGTKTKKQKKEKLKSKTDMLRGIGKQSGNQWSQSILAQQIAASNLRKRALISIECRNTCLVVALVSGTCLFSVRIITIIIHIMIYMLMASSPRTTAKVHPVHLMNADPAPDGCQPSDQAKQPGL